MWGEDTDSCFLRKDGSCENIILQNVAIYRTAAELLRGKGNRKDFKKSKKEGRKERNKERRKKVRKERSLEGRKEGKKE